MSEFPMPAALLEKVRRDLRPVRPLAPPWRRALAVAPLAVLLLLGQPLLWQWRSNLSALGGPVSWGLSVLQAAAGLTLVGAALREAVPGRRLPGAALLAALGGGVALVLGVTLFTAHVLPTVMPPAVALRFWWECWGMAVLAGLPAMAAAASLSARLLAGRPAVAGALYGLGAGLMTDAGVRLFCWVTAPEHVILAHGGAVLTFAALGAAVSAGLERWKG
jgi:hypothetical protein